MIRVVFGLLLAVSVAGTGVVRAETPSWPGFLGAGATPPHADQLPLHWGPDKNIAWKTELAGYGQSSPVVWQDHVFVTSVEGANKETLRLACLDLESGKVVWEWTGPSSMPAENSLYVSRSAPTPVVDAAHVYAFFESGDLVAVEHGGKVAWQRSLSKEFGKITGEFGLGSSPAQTADTLFILVDDPGPVSYLTAVRKSDGATAWKVDRTSRQSWSSPILVDVAGTPQLVVSSTGSVDGYELTRGEKLWSITDVGGNTTTSPLDAGEGRFLVGATPGREAGPRGEAAKKSNILVQIVKTDAGYEPKVLWRAKEAMPSFGSPIVHRGHAYYVNRSGVLFCVDAATGEQKYAERTAQSVWATPLGVDDRLYLFGKEGHTTVIAAGPEFKVLAENDLWDPAAVVVPPNPGANEKTEGRQKAAATFSGPVQYGYAAVGNRLVIRTGKTVYCVQEPKQ